MVLTRTMKKRIDFIEEPNRSLLILGLFPLYVTAASFALTIITLFGLRTFSIVVFSLLGIFGVPIIINLNKI
jgi:hypothetical protein